MIGTALIGFGWWGQHIARRLKDHPDFDILSVVEPALELHTQIEDLGLNAALGYKAALNDPSVQAVILTSPNDLHDSQILEAVAAGKHVFCEKPPAKTLSELISVQNILSKRPNLKLMYGFNHRFHLSVEEAKSIINKNLERDCLYQQTRVFRNPPRQLNRQTGRTL